MFETQEEQSSWEQRFYRASGFTICQHVQLTLISKLVTGAKSGTATFRKSVQQQCCAQLDRAFRCLVAKLSMESLILAQDERLRRA